MLRLDVTVGARWLLHVTQRLFAPGLFSQLCHFIVLSLVGDGPKEKRTNSSNTLMALSCRNLKLTEVIAVAKQNFQGPTKTGFFQLYCSLFYGSKVTEITNETALGFSNK